MSDAPIRLQLDAARQARAQALEADLLARLEALGSLLVAFSGGVDSAYLAWAARRALNGRALAVTGVSESLAAAQKQEAEELARLMGIQHRFVVTRETSDSRYRENTPDRCYFCKSELFDVLERLARAEGFAAVADGTNADDLGDLRPGRRAASERRVLSPLAELGLDKDSIRWLSRRAGLPSWHRPASPCLSSRIPHFSPVTPEKLAAVERAEEAMRRLGYREYRVRHHGDLGRVELAAGELERALEPCERQRIEEAVAAAGGFLRVQVDGEPFRSGRLCRASAGEQA